jgi:hypothetical protein
MDERLQLGRIPKRNYGSEAMMSWVSVVSGTPADAPAA